MHLLEITERMLHYPIFQGRSGVDGGDLGRVKVYGVGRGAFDLFLA